MEKYPIYKQTKVEFVFITSIFGLVGVALICVNHWSDGSVYKIILGAFILLYTLVYILAGRQKMTIKDDLIMFHTSFWLMTKISIAQIEDIKVTKSNTRIKDGVKPKKILFNQFSNEALFIRLNTGKAYHIIIKNAEQIKEEIEKRMLNLNVNR